ncbi:MAG: hypothetical protein AB7V27_08235 [Candidatus Binatia bacterium]
MQFSRVGWSGVVAVVAVCAFVRPGCAETNPAPPGTVEPGNLPIEMEKPAPLDRGEITFTIGADFATAYYFRGIRAERNGVVFQPYGTLNFLAYEDDDGNLLDYAYLSLGTWHSFHSKKSFADGGPSSWFEADVSVGPTFGFAQYFVGSVAWAAYMSPNGAFSTAHEFTLNLAFNDSEFLGGYALQPSIGFGYALISAGFGVAEGGVYAQPGIKPSTVLFKATAWPVTVAVPISVGLSLHDYYAPAQPDGDFETFGFFNPGLIASIPLAFMPAQYGLWSFSIGVDLLVLSDTLKALNRGDRTTWVGRTGLLMTY